MEEQQNYVASPAGHDLEPEISMNEWIENLNIERYNIPNGPWADAIGQEPVALEQINMPSHNERLIIWNNIWVNRYDDLKFT